MSVSFGCSGYIDIRQGDTFRMSFLALYIGIVDLAGYTITAWMEKSDGGCFNDIEVVDIDPAYGTFDLLCEDTTEWPVGVASIAIKFISPTGFADSTESIKINVIDGGCSV